MRARILLAAAVGAAVVSVGQAASAYTTFPPWHVGLAAFGDGEQCLHYDIATEWAPVGTWACAFDVHNAVQFNPSSSPGVIRAWDGSCLDLTRYTSSNNQVSFSSSGGCDGATLWTYGSNELHDWSSGECLANDSYIPTEAACSSGDPAEWIFPLEQQQTSSIMYAYWPAKNQNLVVDLYGNDVRWYQGIDVWGANGGPAQNWGWVGGGAYPGDIVLMENQAWCLTADSPSNGAKVYLAPCGDHPYQQWVSVYPHQIVLAGTEACLDVPAFNLNEGTMLDVWSCNGGLNQQFNSPPFVSPD